MDIPVQQFRTKAEQAFLDLYAKAEKGLPGAGNPFVSDLRRAAIKTYAHLGLPHRRIEAWKYTDLRARIEAVPPLIAALGVVVGEAELEAALGKAVAQFRSYRLVLAEGELRVDLSDLSALRDKGVDVASLGHVLEMPPDWVKATLGQVNPREDDPVLALNAALMTGGVALRLKDGVTLDRPIHIIHLDGTGEAATMVTRNVILVGEGASATVLESYGSLGLRGLQRNAVTEVVIGDRGAIDHIKFQRDAEDAFHLGVWLADLGADARYNAFQLSLGASLARNQVYTRFSGENSSADISGAMLLRRRQHCDTTILVEHLVPHCGTRELLKAVVDEEARGVFQGKIVVSPGAQKTDSKQMAQALLLGAGAEFDSKPELEIFADDVICGHGATSGQIDQDLLFYLESRGLPEAQARAMLIQAFVGAAFEQVGDETLREAFAAASADWLGVALD